jgi:hypothetical protein
MTQNKITSHLQSLKEIDGISVEISGSTNGTIRVEHKRHHAPEFLFRWHTDHFVGYFIDSNRAQSQAVVSLYTPMDAIRFISAYATLNEIRANQKSS